MTRTIGRRGFIKTLVVGLVGAAGIPLQRPAVPPCVRTLIKAPGDVAEVQVSWPAGIDPVSVQFVHCVDGRVAGVAPVVPPGPGSDQVLRLAAECSGLGPGHHQFVLQGIGGAKGLGGFVIRPFAFGC